MLSRLLKGMVRNYAERRQRRRAFDELSALDDRSLADIGIARSEIPYVLAHAAAPDPRPVRQPAPPSPSDLRRAA